MVKCPSCGFENEEGALFCDQCKSDIGAPDLTRQAEKPPDEGPRMSASFVGSPAEPVTPVPAVAVEETSVTDGVPMAEVAVEARPLAEITASESIHLAETESVMPMSTPAPPPSASAESTGAASAEQTLPAAGVMEGAAAAPSQPATLPEGAKPKLVTVRGQRLNVEYPLYEGANYLGRADEKAVDVDLEDQEPPDRIWSSRQHAVITLDNGTLTIEDLNSTNGTFVNRTRVHPGQKRTLQVNDVVQIGTVHLKVQA